MKHLFVFLLTATTALASYTGEIISLTVTSGDYIIASDADRADPGYERDEIAITASLNFTGSGTSLYRTRYSLLDPDGNPVLLKSAAPVPVTVAPGSSFTVTSPGGRIVMDRIAPVTPLEPGKLYQVRLFLQKQTSPPGTFETEDTQDTAPRRYIHFTNTDSDDAAVNVRSHILHIEWVKRFACDTDPANDAFVAEAELHLHRYDAFLSTTTTTNLIPHRITYQLVEFPGGEVVGIANNTTGPSYNMTQHAVDGGITVPYVRTVTREFNIKPGAQLDPVNKSYQVIATLSHEEIPGDPYLIDHENDVGPASTLLHYNGRLAATGDGDELTITSIINDPFDDGFTHLGTELSTSVVINDLEITGHEGYQLDPLAKARLSTLLLQPDGTALYDSVLTFPFAPPASPDIGTTANVRFIREGIFFNKDGLQGNVKVILPAGMGAYLGPPDGPSNHILETVLGAGPRSFTQELRPQANNIIIPSPTPGHAWHIRHESKPVEITALQILWNLNTGQFAPGVIVPGIDRCRYVRRFEIDFLAAAPIPASEKVIASNELYYNHVAPAPAAPTTWAANADGVAEMSATLAINPGAFTTHFPLEAMIEWSSPGTIEINANNLVPATSSLPDAAIVEMQYARDCPVVCDTVGNATVKLDPAAAPFSFTRDGGLTIPGTYIVAGSRRDIVIGYIDALSSPGSPVHTHDTTIFQNGRFLMAGHHLAASEFSQEPTDGPGVLLNTGFDPADPDAPERPGQPAYLDGLGDYPGMNYRVAAEASAPTAVSILGGQASPTYALSSRSKYYTRRSGVSGIHEPASNPFPGPFFIYGYEFNFTSFGLSFLGSQVHDSITAGSLDIPFPSNFTLAFDPLFFDCLGRLTTAGIPGGSFDASLEFWNAAFTGISAHFQPAIGADCDPSEANLVVGVRTHASNIAPTLAGALGFHPNGNLITAADARLEGVDSRLALPSVLELAGPNNETYAFFPTHNAYYENHTHSSETRGRLSFAGLLDVPFFEDLEVHFHTGTTEGNTTDAIHMMAGWPGDGGVADPTFDLANRSYPATDTLANYRALADDAYRPRAVHDWLGVVRFDYPLDWDTTTRSFRASEPVANDLMVVTTEHELRYLSADNVEIDFGASLDLDIPAINLANISINLVEDTGVLNAIESALTPNVAGALLLGLDFAASLIDDRLDTLFDEIFETRVDPLIATLVDALDAIPEGTNALANRQDAVQNHLINNVLSVKQALTTMDGAVGEPGTLIGQIDESLARFQIAIRTVIGRVEVSGGQVVLATGPITFPEEAVITAGGVLRDGIFADADGTGYDIAKLLTTSIIEQLAPDIAASLSAVLTTTAGGLADKLEPQLNALFAESAPTLDRVKTVLLELHNTIQQLRDAGAFYSEISDIIFAATGNIDALLTSAEESINAFLASIAYPEYRTDEIHAVIRTAVRDKFNGSLVIVPIHALLRAYVYDLDAAVSQSISSAFAEVNRITARLLKNALPGDTSLAPMLGDLAAVAAAGEIDGFARIHGDALRTLRLDASLRLKLPDDFEFNGFLEINQLNSDGDTSCSFAGEGEYAAEVILGAVDVPVAWSGDGLRFDISTKFTFDTAENFRLRGLGGGIEMTQGTIGFENMGVTSLAAATVFGLDENYLAARVGLRFQSYRLDGGIFFGRTCSVDPLKLVDPDVIKVLGQPPFTGIYAYGEAQIPIVDIGCLFRLSAKAGAGVFWFQEGNTYGGKMKVGATGRALCAVGVGGDLTLIGSKSGNNYTFYGKGRVFGEVGKCKVCTRFQETVELTYKNNKWSYNY